MNLLRMEENHPGGSFASKGVNKAIYFVTKCKEKKKNISQPILHSQ